MLTLLATGSSVVSLSFIRRATEGTMLCPRIFGLIYFEIVDFFCMNSLFRLFFLGFFGLVRQSYGLFSNADCTFTILHLLGEGKFSIWKRPMVIRVILGHTLTIVLNVFAALHLKLVVKIYYSADNQLPPSLLQTSSSLIITIMSIKWYEKHLEQIIRENQILKYQAKRNNVKETLPQDIAAFFAQLFPEIPVLNASVHQTNFVQQQLQYYKKAVGKWLQKEKMKMDYLMSLDAPQQLSAVRTQTPKVNVNKSFSHKEEKECIFCRSSGRKQEKSLSSKMSLLQKQMADLEKEIADFEKGENKYLGEISHLRSITKKLEFELAQALLIEDKIKKVMLKQSETYETEIRSLSKEVTIWKSEYERIWKDCQRLKNITGIVQKFEEERTLLNTSYKQDREHCEESSSHSNIWVIKGESFEQSYIVEDHQNQSELSFINSEKH